MALLFALILAVVSIILITKGSDWATDSLVPVAKKLGTSNIAVAIILVSIMVSLPEIIISIYSTLLGHINISLGVIIGSIICNIGLMTGLSAMIKPLPVSKSLILRDGIFAVTIAITVLVLSMDKQITQAEGAVFILMFIPYLINVWVQEKAKHEEQKKQELKDIELELNFIGLQFAHLKAGLGTFFLGVVVLLAGSYLFTEALIQIANFSGISDLLIGLTIGAIGPSIPNIVTAVQGTLKNIDEMAVSETLGSDIFTLLVTLGILSMIQPINLANSWLVFDIPVMVIMSILMLVFMVYKQGISRLQGSILFFSYIAVLVTNIFLHI